MLTSDLVRTSVGEERVEPEYVDSSAERTREKAAELVEIFSSHRDRPRGEVDRAVDRATGYGTDYKIWRGLAKLLYDRSEFETVAPADPVDIRRAVFERAAERPGRIGPEWRQTVFDAVADEFDAPAERLRETLYADLDERQRLVEFEAIEPEGLLHRYNLALAQAVLYRATSVEILLRDLDPNMLRYLFQALKFNRLMHRCESLYDGYRLRVDGPASLFQRNRKYGMRLARFLPAVVLADDWALEADLDWEEDEKRFRVDSDEGLVSHYTADGQWKADEEEYFEEQFDDYDTEWSLEREGAILELTDNEVIIPDYRLDHPDGRRAHLEIVGFWRLEYLKRRIELLRRCEDIPLALAVSDRLQAGREGLEDSPAAVFYFKTVILVDRAIEAAEAVALDRSGGGSERV